MMINDTTRATELTELCSSVRALAKKNEFEQAGALICQAMQCFPCAPQHHNLLGILLEKTGEHVAAMKHFRAAIALDPTYGPARQNLETYGTFYSAGTIAYDENDCFGERKGLYRV